jgi:hypothetical protein
VVKSQVIPATTQLFTPNWIIKCMVQNSLGAQWLATYPASAPAGELYGLDIDERAAQLTCFALMM